MVVLAINTLSRLYPLGQWITFWEVTGARKVVLVQDTDDRAGRIYELLALGTEILIDRQGAVAFRSDGPAGYEKLRSEIEKVL